MKSKIFAAFSAMILSLSLCGCGASAPIPGEELVLSARKWYTSLDSAKVEIVDNKTGGSEQTFIFKYDEKGVMTYSYVGKGEGISLAQYNNGREQFTDDNGEIELLDASDLMFTAYSRDVPYPMADEGLILFYKSGIIPEKSYTEEAVMLDAPNGITVHHEYDVSKIASQFSGEGELTAFSVDYTFESDGTLMYFCENTEILSEGETTRREYTIYISERNAVERVENVVDISSISD